MKVWGAIVCLHDRAGLGRDVEALTLGTKSETSNLVVHV